MAFHYRILFGPKNDPCNNNRSGPRPGHEKCATPPVDLPPPTPPPPPPSRPLPPVSHQANQPVHHMSAISIIMLSILGVAFVLVGYFLLVMKYYSDLNNSRRGNSPIFEEDTDETEDFFDENQGPVLDHPIWYINTVGLQQTVIDTITLFKYKRDDGLIEGTECSVCLNEFQEDESLRLLPKCSHAFHTPCIDTWLRSHTNCPLCRAPVVSDPNHAHVSIVEPNSSDLGATEEDARVENLENYGGLESRGVGEDGTSEIRVGAESSSALPIEGLIAQTLEKDLHQFNAKNCGVRVLSDLADHRPNVEEEELQPVRRSVSMDSSSAAMIYRAMANIPPVEHEGCSDTMSVQVKKPNSEKAAKRVNRSSSIYRLNSSFGRSIQKGHLSMKRSFSSGRKFSLSRSSRSQDSILPL